MSGIEERTIKLGRPAQTAIRKLRELRAKRDEIDIAIKVAEAKIKAEIGEPPLGERVFATVGGLRVASWSSTIRQTVNMALLRKRDPELVRELTTESEVRTFKLLGEKE